MSAPHLHHSDKKFLEIRPHLHYSDKNLDRGANEYNELGSLAWRVCQTLNSLNFLNSLYCRYNPLRDIAQARNE